MTKPLQIIQQVGPEYQPEQGQRVVTTYYSDEERSPRFHWLIEGGDCDLDAVFEAAAQQHAVRPMEFQKITAESVRLGVGQKSVFTLEKNIRFHAKSLRYEPLVRMSNVEGVT